ncbi:phosphatidylinositol N-acetylglucosaminyltransferase subunit A-like isoform X1 [Dermacentor silvarum]|uniref:phosphatidylinositol N-acetylglucosaminyltransferase subunit A-like isoform X1 n=1 Tax=Dermacentor silvarum TaxID=543639 RepID=UPI001898107F|nr:phosphatidylinositol N-acetylglucosaminyltransferase subunit A-like isoform X1 [Dermacentor silvarum]
MERKRHRICMVSDFFYPNTGGVESHIYQLSQCLLALGHKVCVITHAYGDRKGVRYMTSGLKVYYLPFLVIYNQCTLPTIMISFPLIRNILIREEITVVHAHSAFSSLALEVMLHASTLGLRAVFTDHSLFGFADASAIITNKLLSMSLSFANHVICVSHTGKENTVLRANVPPARVSVIPNAVETAVFFPDLNKNPSDKITIIVVSRLVYRKGVDLMAGVIPVICNRHPNVQFIIGGDGPKRLVIEEVRERHRLQERITMLGAIEHDSVRDVMVQGDIFLNASLTEAFCMAIVEACACGLQVVSTRVGGVPEVLPPDLIHLCDPSVRGLLEGLECAIERHRRGDVVPAAEAHARVSRMYQWENVAKRTQRVYDAIDHEPPVSLRQRLDRAKRCGFVFAQIFWMVIIVLHVTHLVLSYARPNSLIDKAVDYPAPKTAEKCSRQSTKSTNL